MTMRTKGDMCGLTVRTEEAYGTVSGDPSEYAGSLLTMSTPDDVTVDTTMVCGSQVRGDVYRVATAAGYTAAFNMVRGQGWEKWAVRALGSASGAKSTLPSFSTLFRASVGEEHLLTGCKVNSLSITAGNLGEKLEFSVTAVSRWHTMTPFRDVDGSTLTMAPAPVPRGIPVTYSEPWAWSTDGVNFTPIRGKGFALSIERSLASDPGVSGDGYRLEAGADSVPQDVSIKLDITVTSTGPEWDRLRLAFTKGVTVKGVIDGRTVTLKDCYLDPSMPDRSQGTYDETVGWIAADMTVE